MRSVFVPSMVFGLALALVGCPEKKVVVRPVEPVKKVVRVKPAEQTFNEGLEALAAKDVERGLQLVREAMAKKPEHLQMQVSGHYNIGAVLLGQGDLAGAEAAFREVLTREQAHQAALLGLGVVFKRQQKYKEAIEHYKAALERVPRDPEIMNNLIVVYRLDKQYAEAEKTGHRLLARAPTNVEAYKNLTLIYYDQGKYEMAELLCINAGKMLEKMRAKDPGVPEDAGIYNNLGMIYVGMKRYREALAQFDKALKIDPGFIEALINLAAIAHRFRDYDKALAAYEQVLKADPENAIAKTGKAYAVFGLGESKAALPLFEGLLAANPGDTRILWNMASIYDEQLRDYAKAVELYTAYKAKAGSGLKSDDPVHKKLEVARQKLAMAAEMKQEQEEEDRKAREEEERKKKALEEAKKETSAEGKQKLEEMLQGGDETAPPAGPEGAAPEGEKPPATPAPEGEKPPAVPAPEGEQPPAAPAPEGEKPPAAPAPEGEKPPASPAPEGEQPPASPEPAAGGASEATDSGSESNG